MPSRLDVIVVFERWLGSPKADGDDILTMLAAMVGHSGRAVNAILEWVARHRLAGIDFEPGQRCLAELKRTLEVGDQIGGTLEADGEAK